MKKFIATSKAPAALTLLSQAVLESSKYRLEISGQVGKDPVADKLVEGGIEPETHQTFKNIEAILSAVGWTLENVTKVRIFLVDMADYATVNEIYVAKFKAPLPARTAVAVQALPLGARIEIDCVAAGDEIYENSSL